MNEQEALAVMVPPGRRRPGKYREGVVQIHLTRACDKNCFSCTQGSNLRGPYTYMSVEHFDQACTSLHGYFGVVGVFGGNPALHPQFVEICATLRQHFPKEQCGLWCNNPLGHGAAMRQTFDPAVSNLNVHLDRAAYAQFKHDWPESRPFGLDDDSRHSPPFAAMRDLLKPQCGECNGTGSRDGGQCKKCSGSGRGPYDESRAWQLISDCDINKHWSALVGEFRGELRAWFCEIAGAQSMLHQGEPSYPDTGLVVVPGWWELPMQAFAGQVRKHCHECGVPLKGYGQLAQSKVGCEQVSQTHAAVYQPKRRDRPVQCVDDLQQLGVGRLKAFTHYMQNAKL